MPNSIALLPWPTRFSPWMHRLPRAVAVMCDQLPSSHEVAELSKKFQVARSKLLLDYPHASPIDAREWARGQADWLSTLVQ
jgi:hypothetical protein